MNSFANSFGLEADDMKTILSIFSVHPEIETAVLYGSRAVRRFKSGSDIDLVLTGKNLTDRIVLDVRSELSDSNVPYMIDVVAENEIKDENLKREIDRTGKVFYMQIPTEQDWANPYDDLDIGSAKECFFGKTLEEAEKMFVYNALHYQEDVMWMPSVPFRYYVHAYMNYLLDSQSEHDTDTASCFLGLVEFKAGLYKAPPRTFWAHAKYTVWLASMRFLGVIKHNVNGYDNQSDQNDLRAVWLRVKETIEYIRNNPDWFDWNESIYGNLEARTTRLLSWNESTNSNS